MKKSLLALAAMGAFAGAAQAQSSVTVYGTLDASMGRVDTGATTTNGITTKLVGGALTSDRLGFRGVEDLGGGVKRDSNLQACTALIGEGGEQAIIVRIPKPSSASQQSPYNIVVSGIEDSSIEVLVP